MYAVSLIPMARGAGRRLVPLVVAALAVALQVVTAAAQAPPAASARDAPAPPPLPVTEHRGAAALGLELRRLGTVKRVLMIAAHPDDEDTQMLSALVLGQGAHAAYLSLNRGEGGQNGIGPELHEALGVIRTEELLAARRLDGAAQFFTRAYDFGYSKTLDETFRHWPRDSVLADVVAVVRAFRPDVILTVFSGTPRDRHGHHQAAGVLAREAFAAAGDPARFPEQLARGLRPHSPAKLYRSSWFRPEEATLHVPTGELDPLLGRSYHQIAMASRSRHRSQDMGRLELPGPRSTHVQRVAAPPTAPPADEEESLFAGIDTTLAGRLASLEGHADASAPDRLSAALRRYERLAAEARAAFNPLEPGALVPVLADALAALGAADSALARIPGAAAADLRFLAAAQAVDAGRALAAAGGLVLDAVTGARRLVPGETVEVELTLWNGGGRDARVRRLEPALPAGWHALPLDPLPDAPLPAGQALTRRFEIVVPTDAEPSQPYYLRKPRPGSMYVWPAAAAGEEEAAAPLHGAVGVPVEPPPVRAEASVELAGARLPLEAEAVHRSLDRRSGEIRRRLIVVPAVSVVMDPEIRVLPLGPAPAVPVAGERAASAGDANAPPSTIRPLSFGLRLRAAAADGVAGRLRLELPAGWRAEPAVLRLRFRGPGEEAQVEIRVVPPAGTVPGEYRLGAVFEADDGRRFRQGYDLIDYPHIPPRPLFRAAAAAVRAFEVDVPARLRVGYVLGAGDRVPDALAQLGLDLTLLDEAGLAAGELERFDAIVIGSRAYEVRPELVANNRRLLEYARRGGTLIVQYQQYEFVDGGFAPIPLTIARPHDRVTDHESPVHLVDPAHPAFVRPNRIDAADFDGWVQERGLYFASSWDDAYAPLLELRDPGEEPLRGGLLVAPYGDGVYVYTGLAFFRQLPAGVPGAFRLFTNLLALRADQLWGNGR